MSQAQHPELDRRNLEHAHNRVFSLVRKKFRIPKAEAEDVVAVALTRALEKLPPTLDKPLVAWLTTTAARIAIDEGRKRARRDRLMPKIERQEVDLAKARWSAPDTALLRKRAAAAQQRLREAMSADDRRFFDIWVRQKACEISRSTAISRLGCTMAQYEAAKKRLKLRLPKLAEELGMSGEELWTEDAPTEARETTKAKYNNEETA